MKIFKKICEETTPKCLLVALIFNKIWKHAPQKSILTFDFEMCQQRNFNEFSIEISIYYIQVYDYLSKDFVAFSKFSLNTKTKRIKLFSEKK